MKIEIEQIGIINNERKVIEDDFWANVNSTITIDSQKFGDDCLNELSTFSHLEIIYFMNKLQNEEVYTGSRHPRNNKDFPKVGIFAQRVKKRPNLLGLSRCQIIKVEKNVITVKGLDALDKTPVIDIKPVMKQFEPIGEIKQPKWVDEVMKDYYK